MKLLRLSFLHLVCACALLTAATSVPSQEKGPVPLDAEKGKYSEPPVPITLPQPVYPFEMRRKGVEADVVVEFTVDVDGRTKDAKVGAMPQKGFEQSALAAVEKARFKPAMKDGKPVAIRLRVTLFYRLNPR